MNSLAKLGRSFSTWTFHKGRLSLQKLKDKALIDETID